MWWQIQIISSKVTVHASTWDPEMGAGLVGKLQEFPSRLQLPLESTRARSEDRLRQAKLQHTSAFVWARSENRPGWATLQDPMACMRARAECGPHLARLGRNIHQ